MSTHTPTAPFRSRRSAGCGTPGLATPGGASHGPGSRAPGLCGPVAHRRGKSSGASRRHLLSLVVLLGAGLWAGPALRGPGAQAAEGGGATAQRHPDVIAVKARAAGGGRFDFDVTISSPYDTPARYADAFRVLAPDGAVLGVRTLFHDHQHEQPFTRDLYGVAIPPGIAEVTVQGRDQRHGWGGRTMTVVLPTR